MNKTQMQQIAVVALLLAFVTVWTMTRTPARHGVTALKTIQQGSRQQTAAPAPPAAPKTAPAPAKEVSAPTRDPFQLPSRLKEAFRQQALEREQEKAAHETQKPVATSRTETQLPALNLQGILWGTSKPQAIINRQILSVGDTIEQAEVVAVTKEGVTLLFNGREVELKLPTVGGGQQKSSR